MSVGKAAASPIRRLRASELAEVFDHGETLRLQFPKEDLGYVYAAGAGEAQRPSDLSDGDPQWAVPAVAVQLAVAVCSAVIHLRHACTALPSYFSALAAAVCHGPGDAAAVADYQRPKPRDAPYTPTTLVGARLPHVSIQVRQPGRLLAEGGSHEVASTIDLPAAAGTSLLLLLSDSQKQAAWEAAAAAAEAATGVPVSPVVVSQPAAGSSSSSSTGGSGSAAQGTTVAQDMDGSWLRLRGIAPEGALLVRPDGHIAWRHSGGSQAGQLGEELECAVRTVMDRR